MTDEGIEEIEPHRGSGARLPEVCGEPEALSLARLLPFGSVPPPPNARQRGTNASRCDERPPLNHHINHHMW